MSNKKVFFFTKINYQLIVLGILFIIIGFILMIGFDANTRENGIFDLNYWNADIFSFNRIRLSSLLIFLGYVIEIFSIFYQDDKDKYDN